MSVALISFLALFRRSHRLSFESKKRRTIHNSFIFSITDNIEHIKLVSGEKKEKKRIDELLNHIYEQDKKDTLVRTSFFSIPNWVLLGNIPIFFLFITLLISKFDLLPSAVFLVGNFVSHFQTVRHLNSEVGKLSDMLSELDYMTGTNSELCRGVSSLKTDKKEQKAEVITIPFEAGDIIFSEVGFSYPGAKEQQILRNFNFVFEKGKTYGIIGKNGMGKSTITKTLMKLYEVDRGVIKIGTNDVKKINTVDLHKSVCYQTNRPAFFGFSIAENVYYPFDVPSNYKEELRAVSRRVGIEEFINRLPEGFDTIIKVGVAGSASLSEGQKQQISAMKIFLCEYDVYVLDEVLSNVSPDLRKKILEDIFTHIRRNKNAIAMVIDHHYGVFEYVDELYQFSHEGLKMLNKKDVI